MHVAKNYGAKIIDRPPELATSEAILEDVFVYAYEYIKNQEKKEYRIDSIAYV